MIMKLLFVVRLFTELQVVSTLNIINVKVDVWMVVRQSR